MKKTRLFIAMTILAAAASLSSCGAGNISGTAAGTSSPAENVKVTFIETTGEGGIVGEAADAAVQEHGEFTEKLPAAIPGTNDTDTDKDPDTSGNDSGEQTTELDPSELEISDLGESLGEFKDESYWERMLDKDSRPTHSDKVFLICVEPETPEYVINDFIEKYGFTVIYDYENFNMYALEAPEPKSEDEIYDFCKELESYSFVLSAEPDGMIYLDDPVQDISLF